MKKDINKSIKFIQKIRSYCNDDAHVQYCSIGGGMPILVEIMRLIKDKSHYIILSSFSFVFILILLLTFKFHRFYLKKFLN